MFHANNEKLMTTYNGKIRTTKSRKNQNAWRKGNLQTLGIVEADTIKRVEMKEKNKK